MTRVTLTFSEIIDPQSVLAGWTGAAQNVVVRITNNAGGDLLTVRNAANTAQLPLGSVNLIGTAYVTANRDFGATGTASTMVQSGTTITITLGTPSGATGTQADDRDDDPDADDDPHGRRRQHLPDDRGERVGRRRRRVLADLSPGG